MTGPGDPSDAAEPGEPLDDDERWLRAREEGSALPPLASERAAAYDALTEMVRGRERIAAPSAARGELSEALDREEARRRRAIRLRRAAAVAAAAVVGISIWLAVPRTSSFMVVAIKDELVRSGSAPANHHVARVEAKLIVDASDPELKELRLYRDDRELVARCPGHAGCSGGGTHWTLTMRFEVVGRYRAIRVDKVSVDPKGGYDADVAALRSAGAVLVDDHIIDVR